MRQRVSSVEVADLLIRQRCYMTVAEVTRLVEKKFPHMVVSKGAITNILRTFVKSPCAQCLVDPDAYPRRYMLESVNNYIFKVRGRRKVSYDGLVVRAATKKELEKREREHISVCLMARELMDKCLRGRMQNTPLI